MMSNAATRSENADRPRRGNCTIRAATRRRHAVGMLLMLPFPPAAGPDRASSSDARLLCPVVGGKAWPGLRKGIRLAPGAAAGPGRASRSTTPSEARVWRSRGRAAAHRHTQRPSPTKQATRRQGLAGLREDTPSQSSAPPAPPVWRAPEGPEGTGGLRGAAPNEVRPPSLAGGRALRRPEHQRGLKRLRLGDLARNNLAARLAQG